MSVKFPAYRRFSDARIEVNDSMMALLIGSRLGQHALATSAASPDVLLPTLFGQISGIQRLNLTTGRAAELLGAAELHLSYMAIPYVLAVHQALLVTVAGMVREDGKDDDHSFSRPRVEDLTKLTLESGHEYVAERCSATFDSDLLPLFHLTRRVRNRIVHFGGAVGSRLLSEYRTMPKRSRDSWDSLAGRPLPDAARGERLDLGEGELVAVLAISHATARALNAMVVDALSRSYWARLAVDDYRAQFPGRFGERDQRLRRVKGFARRFYMPLELTDDELRGAYGE